MTASWVVVLFWSLSCTCVAGRAWPTPSADALPNVEISLEPPAKPRPEVSADIGSLEDERARAQDAHMRDLHTAYAAVLERQKHAIGDVVGRAMRVFNNPSASAAGHESSFIRLHSDAVADAATVAFKINVLDFHAAPDAQNRVDALEHARADMERSAFEQAKLDLSSAADFFQRELESQIQLQMNECVGVANALFSERPVGLRGFTRVPKQANVRVVAAETAYPTVGSMVQAMETRRDTAEHLAGLQVLDMQLELLKVGNAMAKEALSHAVERIMTQSAFAAHTS